MKTIKFLSIALMAICLASCGGKKETKESNDSDPIVLKPAETTVSGDMEDCFTVVDKEYKGVKEDYGWDKCDVITVELERTDKELPFELNDRELDGFGTTSVRATVQVGFGIEFLDADGNVVDKQSAEDEYGGYDRNESIALCKLKSGKKGTIRFRVLDKAKDAVSFRITTVYKENESTETGSSADNDDDSSTASSGSEDWDALLSSYEQYVDQYIKLMKKASNGDASAMTEYASFLEKAQEVSNKMSGAKGSMSASQWAKYMKITNKMASAAQGL